MCPGAVVIVPDFFYGSKRKKRTIKEEKDEDKEELVSKGCSVRVVLCLIDRFRLYRSLLYMSFPTVHLVLIICAPNYAEAENIKQDFPPKSLFRRYSLLYCTYIQTGSC